MQKSIVAWIYDSSVQNGYLFANANRRRLMLLIQQKELEDVLTTDLDANEDVPDGYCDGTQALVREVLTSSGFSLGCTITKD